VHSVVGEISIFEDLSVSTGPVGKVPSMDFFALVVNELDGTWTGEVREERVAWGDFLLVDTAKSHTAAKEVALLHYGRAESRVTGEEAKVALNCSLIRGRRRR
jgi:hypothetical protein